MSVEPTPEQSDARHSLVHLTLTWPEAESLRITLPWLLRALDDRDTLSPRLRERRRTAHTALDHLLIAVSSQLGETDADDPARLSGALNA